MSLSLPLPLPQSYIYIRDNKWYEQSNVYKVGKTTSIKERGNTYITGEIHKGFYVKIYELVKVNEKRLSLIDNLIKDEFKDYNIYYGGGTEFYNRDIINLIEPFFIKYKIDFISKTEDELNRINRKNLIINNYYKLVSKLLIKKKDEILKLRDYQITAIDYIKKSLIEKSRIYLSLPTGAGKSQIAINVIAEIKPVNILIFSPRISIKKQNSDKKYLRFFKDFECHIYNYCYQSSNKVYDLIIENDIRDLFIWFDEAHWALDNWVDSHKNHIKQFFMNDSNHIKYRLFTSASPDKDFVIEKKLFYGELYEPIRFKELVKKEYLSKIEVEIFEREIEIKNVEYNSLIFNTFNKKGCERKLGFSFHNTCLSAMCHYLHHLKSFMNGEIDIKPYILINEEFFKKYETKIEKEIIEYEFMYNNNDDDDKINMKNQKDEMKILIKNINKIKKELGKDIIYNKDIKEFESEVGKGQKAVGYVVAQYSMGYDNKDIDIIYFTDPKLSVKDIIQSIGRGTRINDDDEKKYLRVILPTNKDNDVGREYIKIRNVLKYLLLEIELDYDKIKTYKFNPYKLLQVNEKFAQSLLSLNINSDKNNSFLIEEDTNEKSIINTMKYEIIAKANQWTTAKLIKQLKFNNIHNLEDYKNYRDINKINLPDINELLEFQNFNFRDTYMNEDECPYYYNKYECIEVIKTYKKELRKINRDNKKLEYLINIDKKIPNMSLWYFYGGKRDDYY